MTRSKKFLLGAILGAALAWLGGTFLVGIAHVQWYTASGTVNMLDHIAIDRALKDPNCVIPYGSFGMLEMWAKD